MCKNGLDSDPGSQAPQPTQGLAHLPLGVPSKPYKELSATRAPPTLGFPIPPVPIALRLYPQFLDASSPEPKAWPSAPTGATMAKTCPAVFRGRMLQEADQMSSLLGVSLEKSVSLSDSQSELGPPAEGPGLPLPAASLEESRGSRTGSAQ